MSHCPNFHEGRCAVAEHWADELGHSVPVPVSDATCARCATQSNAMARNFITANLVQITCGQSTLRAVAPYLVVRIPTPIGSLGYWSIMVVRWGGFASTGKCNCETIARAMGAHGVLWTLRGLPAITSHMRREFFRRRPASSIPWWAVQLGAVGMIFAAIALHLCPFAKPARHPTAMES